MRQNPCQRGRIHVGAILTDAGDGSGNRPRYEVCRMGFNLQRYLLNTCIAGGAGVAGISSGGISSSGAFPGPLEQPTTSTVSNTAVTTAKGETIFMNNPPNADVMSALGYGTIPSREAARIPSCDS